MMTTSNGQGMVADSSVVDGIVEQVNERGIKVAGDWRNLSKFHPLELPARGARVRCELDAKGFLRAVQVLDQAPSAPPGGSTRGEEIRRLAVLKAAATFAAGKAAGGLDVKSSDVLKIAEAWDKWIVDGEPQP